MNPKSGSFFKGMLFGVSLSLALLPAARAQESVLRFDFGGADNQTALPPMIWNNITEEHGVTLPVFIDLAGTEGADVGTQLFVDQFFDETPDQSGTEASGTFPPSASRDSMVSAAGNAVIAIVDYPPDPANRYTLTFYASDLATSENRETRYDVVGANSGSAALNPSGNIDGTVSVSGIAMNNFGEIVVTLSPGPNHTAANRIVYLGALRVDCSAGWTAVVDFGSSQASTDISASGDVFHWNNVTGAIGSSDTGTLTDIVTASGEASSLTLRMIARFNGVNGNGTLSSAVYPATATQDSLYGNTEEWGSLTDIYPSFQFAGLDPSESYDVTFHASRIGTGGDNRETHYTLTGATVEEAFLDPAENIDGTVTVSGIQPDAGGEITIDLAPGPNNNNAYHFTYLGVLKLEVPAQGRSYLFDFGGDVTTEIEVPSQERWNNIVESVGLTDDGLAAPLVTADGTRTEIALEMVARFNGVNRNGTTVSTVYPASATGDSLFGNTESFNGLENVFPVFTLTGLDPENAYSFAFFGSRSATDNRETRYTVTGSSSGVADLNAADNVDGTASVSGIIPTASGQITVAVEPGPNNNNGSHFTYLGMMQVSWVRTFVPRILVDAGGTAQPTTSADAPQVWNNFQGAVGQTDTGKLPELLTVNGTPTPFAIQMIARFNGVNESGTVEPAPYPTTATQDSLFGNTEDWSGLSDIFPSFMLTGLDPAVAYDLTFYASRVATDNRETQYTVTGANQSVVLLNVAGNIDQTAVATGINPTPEGTITVAMAPGPNNDNANHFTYLGVLQLDWVGGLPGVEEVSLSQVGYEAGALTFTLHGQPGRTYQIQGTEHFRSWTEEQSVTLTGESAQVQINIDGGVRFFRATR